MRQLVQTIALGAALVALALAVWRDYGAFTALKRALLAYLAAYFLAGGLGLATRAALGAVRDPEPEAERGPAARTRRPRRSRGSVGEQGKPATAGAADGPEDAAVASSSEETTAEPAHAG
jgi:hypothetical protein